MCQSNSMLMAAVAKYRHCIPVYIVPSRACCKPGEIRTYGPLLRRYLCLNAVLSCVEYIPKVEELSTLIGAFSGDYNYGLFMLFS